MNIFGKVFAATGNSVFERHFEPYFEPYIYIYKLNVLLENI